MSPDQLAHLTDEERRAWEERELAVKALRALTAYAPCRHDATDPAGTHWLKCSDCGRTVPRDHQSNAAADAYEAKAAKVYDAVRLLPAALEALADARRERDERQATLDGIMGRVVQLRRERDEARAELAAMEQRIHARISRNHGVIAHLTDEDGDISDVETAHSLERENEVLARFLTPAELPPLRDCPLCGGSPQCADGIRGLEATCYVYCCQCSARTAETDRGTATRAWNAGDVHASPGEDPAPHVAGAPDAAGGALGVGAAYDGDPPRYYQDGDEPGKPTGRLLGENEVLTNCDTCRHDYVPDDSAGSACAVAGERGDVLGWIMEHINIKGRPCKGATGCPGHSPRANQEDSR